MESFDNTYYKRKEIKRDLAKIRLMAHKNRFGNFRMQFCGITADCHDLLSFYFAARNIFLHRIYDFKASKENPTVIDGGGDVGLFTLFVKQKYPDAKITVFEPDDEAFKLLKNNIALNGLKDVNVVHAGLYKHSGKISIGTDSSDEKSIFSEKKTSVIDVVKLSDYINSGIDFLKLNIEGAELDVITEIQGKLPLVNELVVEYHGFTEVGQNLHKLLEILDRAGLRYMVHDFDAETNKATKPPFQLNLDTRYFLVVYAKRLTGTPEQVEPKPEVQFVDNRPELKSPVAEYKNVSVPEPYVGDVKHEEIKTSINTPAILLYHRVWNDPLDARSFSVSPENFEAQLKILAENYRVLPLRQLLVEADCGHLSPDTVSLTFDDGYLDVLTNALPIIEKYGLHATVFIVSGMVGSGREFWWDSMERIFLSGVPLPGSLQNDLLNDGEVRILKTPDQKRTAYEEICTILRLKPSGYINRVIDSLLEWAGLDQIGRPTHQVVNAGQLKKLGSSSSIEVGSHSVTHTSFSSLPLEEQRKEIRESQSQISGITNKLVRFFSYPFGTADNFSKESIKLVVDEGYSAAVANIHGNLVLPVDMYALPRLRVSNMTGVEFSRWLKRGEKTKLVADNASTREKALLNCLSKVHF